MTTMLINLFTAATIYQERTGGFFLQTCVFPPVFPISTNINTENVAVMIATVSTINCNKLHDMIYCLKNVSLF